MNRYLLCIMLLFNCTETLAFKRTALDLNMLANNQNVNGFTFLKDYLEDCHLFALSVDNIALNQPTTLLLNSYSDNSEKLFFISTTIIGQQFISFYNIISNKDVCFLFLPGKEDAYPLLVLRLPVDELKKTNYRDFDTKDKSSISSPKFRPYNIPPYPLIEVFKKASINNIYSNSDGFRKMEFSKKRSINYHKFLHGFQFSNGRIDEASVEDLYAVYLDMDNEIYRCIDDNDLDCVKGYKRMGFNFKEDPNHEPILNYSVRHNKIKIVEYLLDIGMNPNVIDYSSDNKISPLVIATLKNNIAIVKLLLKHSANPNQYVEGYESPYEAAVRLNYTKISSVLKPLTDISSKPEDYSLVKEEKGMFDGVTSHYIACSNGGIRILTINESIGFYADSNGIKHSNYNSAAQASCGD